MKKSNWVWMPHPAHFILGSKCQFHLATYVGRYIISTIGELWNDSTVRRIHASVFNPEWYKENKKFLGDNFDSAYFKEFGYEAIGLDRKYETMVFKAKKMNKMKCDCCNYQPKDFNEIDFKSYNNAKDAFKGHNNLCNKWSRMK